MNHLITLVAWCAALATVLWQRALRPALAQLFPNFNDLFPPAPVPEIETHESHASVVAPAPRRRSRRSATPKTAVHPAGGFA